MSDETKEARRERNARPHNRAARREYMRSPEGRAVADRAKDRYEKRHPDRAQAQTNSQAKEDAPSAHRCKVCGKPAEHRHHPNYKTPDKIEWLCHTHHVKAHHPKSNLASNRASNRAAKSHDARDARGAHDTRGALVGGRADRMTPADFDRDVLRVGQVHEREHTNDPAIALEIAMDHLAEDPDYYKDAERTARRERREEMKEKSMENEIFKAIMRRDAFALNKSAASASAPAGAPSAASGAVSGAASGAGRAASGAGEEAKKSFAAVRLARAEVLAAKSALLAKGSVHGFPRGIAHGAEEQDADDEVAEADEKALKALDQAAAMLERAEACAPKIMKALAEIEHGEPMSGDALGAGRALVGHAAGDGDGAGGSMNGMPSVDAGQAVTISADDHGLSPGETALESTVPGTGSSGLDSSVNVHMSKAGALSSAATLENERLRASMNKGHAGVNLTIPSTSEDQRITALLEKSGPGLCITPEPSISWQSPLVARRACTMCKSLVPAMFSRCPACGGDHDSRAHGTPVMYVEKSVLDTIRQPVTQDMHMPAGIRSAGSEE